MVKIIKYVVMAFMLVGCSKEAQEPVAMSDKVVPCDSAGKREEALVVSCDIHDEIGQYQRFQTFDEYRMRGVGKAVDTPFVYVRNIGDTIIHVRISNDADSIICYKKIQDIWYNHISIGLGKKMAPITKNGVSAAGGPPAMEFFRFMENNAITEYGRVYIEGDVFEDFDKKTIRHLWVYDLWDYDYGSSVCTNSPIELYRSMTRCMDSLTYQHSGIPMKNPVTAKKAFSFQKEIRNNKIVYRGDDQSYESELNSLGEFSLQPGLYKFK